MGSMCCEKGGGQFGGRKGSGKMWRGEGSGRGIRAKITLYMYLNVTVKRITLYAK